MIQGPASEGTSGAGVSGGGASRAGIRWERTEGQLGRDRTLVDRAIQRRNDLWKEAFTDFDLDPPKPRTELESKQGNKIYVVKWTPELARPASTQGAAEDQPSGNAEEGLPLI